MRFIFKQNEKLLSSDKNSVLLVIFAFYMYIIAHIPLIIMDNSFEVTFYFCLFLIFTLNIFFIKNNNSIRDSCIVNLMIFNFLIAPATLVVIPPTLLVLPAFVFIGLPLFILLKNTLTQIIFGYLNIIYKIIIIYFYFNTIDFSVAINYKILLFELIILSIYFYFILIFLRTFNKQMKTNSNLLTTLATVDELTQLSNRRVLVSLFKGETTPCAVALADVDYFKNVNDSYGHQVGDLVLKEVANIFKKYQYSRLSVVRFGGDEFIFILDEGTIAELASTMEIIRKKVENLNFEEVVPYGVTISCGITECSGGSSWESVLERTDMALYKAKDEGRNRICSIR